MGGLLLLPLSGLTEDWGDFVWSAESVGSIAYLALFGSAIAFVTLTVLLRHISAMAVAFLAMLLPFGALIFGALLYDESITPGPWEGPRWWPPGWGSPSGRAARARSRRRPPLERHGSSARSA